MATYKAPLEDMRFVLNDVFEADKLWASMSATAEVTRDLSDAILDEAGKMVENLLFPLNREGDEQGCHFDNGEVTTPEGFKEAFKTYAENGWSAFSGNPEFGGQGMPKSLAVLFEEMMHSANSSFALYPALTNGATLCLDAHASEELKQAYLPKLYSGEWSGTMCLTEPHCGTDLGIMRSKAVPNDDGSYNISGTKIFITGGEHDMVDNIIHLVLAKLPDAPAGSKGISLFLVPKFLPDANGDAGERNGVAAGSIEHKMGIKGSATCVMNFDDAKGWIIGEPNQGLAAMFTMMNYERLSIGIQGLGLGEVSYQSAADYARERLQGRAATGVQNEGGNADPIIVHGDVRRMLLTMRALNEGGRALSAYVGMELDKAKFSEDEAEQKAAQDRVALMTPVAKAFFTDRGFDTTVIGQQVFGGHGYVREWGMEQLVRDVRIAQIYEGTNGIQAMDLMGRKVAANGAKNLQALIAEMRAFSADSASVAGMDEFLNPLNDAVDNLESLTKFVLEQAGSDANAIGAAANEYLHVMGFTLFSYMWAMMCRTVLSGESQQGEEFDKAKLQTARFFVQRLLPQASALSASIRNGSSTLMDIAEEAFA